MPISCPHCRKDVETTIDPEGTVVCESCGSRFACDAAAVPPSAETIDAVPSALPQTIDAAAPPQRDDAPQADSVLPPTLDGEVDSDTGVDVSDAPPALDALALPDYEVLGELGRGGMGVVYRARQKSLDRVVALKMVLAGAHAGTKQLERFQAEATAAAQLQHPNIVQIYEIGRHDGLPFFSLEYVDGHSLHQRIAGKPQAARWSAQLTETLARAVHYAHQRGIVHRDLKPENVLVTTDGVAKVTDFGLAKRLEGGSSHTKTGTIVGTPSYMAPEQARGDVHHVGPQADVYALGAVLYELITGRPPFLAPSPMETILRVLHDEPVPPTRLDPKISRDLETICLKCLQKEPQKRYGDAQLLADDLHRYLAGEPILARPVGSLERAWRWCKRKPALASLAAALVTAVAIGFAGVTAEWRRAEGQRDLADQRRAQRDLQLTESYLDQGLGLCERGQVGTGMIWLARSLQIAPQEATALRRVLRANLAAWYRHLHPLLAPLEHQGPVYAIAFSPDGTLVLTGSKDKTARLWDADTGIPVGKPLNHDSDVNTVAFAPSGSWLLTGCEDGTAWLWDTTTQETLGPPLSHRDEGAVSLVAVSPDGARLLTVAGSKASLWDAASQQRIALLEHEDEIRDAALSRDGTVVATASMDGTARLWNAAIGAPIGAPLQHDGPVLAVAVSPDSQTVLTGCRDGGARLWNAATGDPIGKPLMHDDMVQAVAFSPDGTRLLTSGADNTARLWETATGKPVGAPMRRHQEWVWALAFSPDGSRLLTGSADGTGQLWDAATQKPIGEPLEHLEWVWRVAFSPDGSKLLTASNDKTARLWDSIPGNSLGQAMRHDARVSLLQFTSDGSELVTGSWDNTARLWDTATQQPIGPPLKHDGGGHVNAVAFSADGALVATGSDDQTARIWDTRTSKPLSEPLPHDNRVYSVSFSPDGTRLLTASRGGYTRLWDTHTGRLIGEPKKHGSGAWIATFAPDGARVLVVSGPHAQFWDADMQQPIGKPMEHQDQIYHIAFSADGARLVTGSWDATARVWDTQTQEPIGAPMRHEGPVLAVAYSADGRHVATGSLDRTGRVWDAATGRPVTPPLEHQGKLQGVAFSPDGATLVTGSWDGTARLWDVATGKPIGAPLEHDGAVLAVAFSPNGSTIATGSFDNSARFWRAPPRPVEGDVGRTVLWVQGITGRELDEAGVVHVLDDQSWHQQRRQLQDLGGAPIP